MNCGVNTSRIKPRVSVIIPLYNKEEYVVRCVHSVMQQTISNFECIIVNDASTDNSLHLVQNEISSYHGEISFCIFEHPRNEGISIARNTGINLAKGDYLLFLDADDELTPNAIAKLVDKANEIINIDIVQGNVQKVPHDNNCYELSRYHFPEVYTDNESIRNRFFDLWKDFPIIMGGRLIRTNFIKENSLYFKEHIIHEDYHWTINAVRKAKSLAFVYDYVFIRHFVPNSIMTSTTYEKSAKYMGIILCDVVSTIEQKDYLRQFKKFLLILTVWTSYAPNDKTLMNTNKLFVRKAFNKHWYFLSIILTLSRWISKTERGRKFSKTMIRWWLSNNK